MKYDVTKTLHCAGMLMNRKYILMLIFAGKCVLFEDVNHRYADYILMIGISLCKFKNTERAEERSSGTPAVHQPVIKGFCYKPANTQQCTLGEDQDFFFNFFKSIFQV